MFWIVGPITLITGVVLFPTPAGTPLGFLQGLGCILIGIGVLFLIICMFYNMSCYDEVNRYINDIKRYKSLINVEQESLDNYKTEFNNILTKLYPTYEKEMFDTMAQKHSDGTPSLMIQYPDLKYKDILTQYIDGINSSLNRINSHKKDVERNYSFIEDYYTNNWIFSNFKNKIINKTK